MNYYPVFLNIKDKRCVVCGGGDVALRKVKTLLENGARVKVVSPQVCPELLALARNGAVDILSRGYQEGDLEGAFLAISATDDRDTNIRIAAEARRRGCLINTVDDAENSDFIVPSCLKRGDIIVAVSTSGTSPALARKIRTRLEKEFDAEYAWLTRLVGDVRAEVKEKGVKVNGNAWQEALDLDLLLALLKNGKEAEAKASITRNLTEQADNSNVS